MPIKRSMSFHQSLDAFCSTAATCERQNLAHAYIAAKVFETMLVDRWIAPVIPDCIEVKEFGSIAGTCTTDALVEMVYKLYEAPDTNDFV